MPELTGIHFGLLALMLVIGVVAGWFIRADRCAKEKLAVNAGWKKQLEDQQSEHNRLADQNKSLMEQISQYQASHRDYTNRARELADSLKEAIAKRDQLQRQLKDIRRNLEVAVAQRDKLRGNLQESQRTGSADAIKERDEKIFRLSRELTSWQSRVPPLVERFQARDREARELAEKLQVAEARIAELEELTSFDQTRIEALNAASLPAGGFASNEPEALTTDDELSPSAPGESHRSGEHPEQDASADGNTEADSSDTEESIESDAEAARDEESAESIPDDWRVDDEPGEADAEDTAHEVASDSDETDTRTGEIVSAEAAPDEAADDEAEVDEAAAETAFTSDDEGGGEDDDSRSTEEEHGEDVEAGSGEVVIAETVSDPQAATANDAPDDLKMIKGIGPSIEKTLNDLGIHCFQQIAEMSEFEIDRVAQQLRGFRSRIYRENWIGQARDLHYEKTSGRS